MKVGILRLAGLCIFVATAYYAYVIYTEDSASTLVPDLSLLKLDEHPTKLDFSAPDKLTDTLLRQIAEFQLDRGDTGKAAVRLAMRSALDGQEFTKKALGKHISKIDPNKLADFVAAVNELGEIGLTKTLMRLDLQRFSPLSVKFLKSEDRAAVEFTAPELHEDDPQSVIVRAKKQENGEWRIYDVILDHIGYLHNYRSDVSGLIVEAGVDGAMRKLQRAVKDKDSRIELVKPAQLTTAEIETALADEAGTLSQVKVTPRLRSGKVIGVKLFTAKRSGVFRKMGLRGGDLIKMANKVPIESDQDLLKLLATGRNAKQIVVSIERDGEERDITAQILNVGSSLPG